MLPFCDSLFLESPFVSLCNVPECQTLPPQLDTSFLLRLIRFIWYVYTLQAEGCPQVKPVWKHVSSILVSVDVCGVMWCVSVGLCMPQKGFGCHRTTSDAGPHLSPCLTGSPFDAIHHCVDQDCWPGIQGVSCSLLFPPHYRSAGIADML